MNRKLLRANFEHEHIGVDEALNGQEAIRVMESRPADIIVSDLHMPQMDGYQLCREWRERDPHRQVPIVLFSATETSPKARSMGLEAGADAYLTKPTPFGLLLGLVKELLDQRKLNGGV